VAYDTLLLQECDLIKKMIILSTITSKIGSVRKKDSLGMILW